MQTLPYLAAEAVNRATFLGEDATGWRIALIAALPAAIVYDVLMTVSRKVTLRIPFLILYVGRPLMSKEMWEIEYAEWKPELWAILHDDERFWLSRLVRGARWAANVVLRARLTAQAEKRVQATEPIGIQPMSVAIQPLVIVPLLIRISGVVANGSGPKLGRVRPPCEPS